jgi:hypothetical protein
VVRVPRRSFKRLQPERPTPERWVEAYYLQRTRFESIAGRKLRRRQLSEDGNIEISEEGQMRAAPRERLKSTQSRRSRLATAGPVLGSDLPVAN